MAEMDARRWDRLMGAHYPGECRHGHRLDIECIMCDADRDIPAVQVFACEAAAYASQQRLTHSRPTTDAP